MLSPAFYFWTSKLGLNTIFINYYLTFNLVSLMAYSAVDVALALWKIIDFSRRWGKFRYSVALYVLLIEIMSNLRKLSTFEFKWRN